MAVPAEWKAAVNQRACHSSYRRGKSTLMKWMFWTSLLCVAVGVSAVGCSKKEPPPRSRPATRVYDRSMAQLGVVKLVVKDRARAQQATAMLERIERLFLQVEREKSLGTSIVLGMRGEPTDEEIRRVFAKGAHHDQINLYEYAKAQVELRKVLTKHEFTRLAEVR